MRGPSLYPQGLRIGNVDCFCFLQGKHHKKEVTAITTLSVRVYGTNLRTDWVTVLLQHLIKILVPFFFSSDFRQVDQPVTSGITSNNLPRAANDPFQLTPLIFLCLLWLRVYLREGGPDCLGQRGKWLWHLPYSPSYRQDCWKDCDMTLAEKLRKRSCAQFSLDFSSIS